MSEVGSLYVRLRADAGDFEATLRNASKTLRDVGDAMQDIGRQLSIVGAAIGAAAGMAIKASIDYESAFAGVRKTVDATEEELQAISQGIRQMAMEIPAAATEIAAVAEAAGQLGIETDNILLFTRTMIDLGEATNMTAVEAATALARLANITQMPQENIDRLGSTIVALGNNLATTEAEIVEMALRIAGAGAQIGLTEAQILAFAGALSSVGIEAEAGGSAISRVMVNIANAVASGGDQLAGFAQVAGMTVAEFQQAFQQDAAGAIIAFIEGLGRMSEAGENVFAVLDELGLSELRVRDALLRAAGAGDLFRNSQELATEAWEKNVALSDEAAQRYATTASQLRIMRNQLMDVAISLGDILVPIIMNAVRPAFEAFVGLLQRGIEWFGSLSERTQTIAVAIGAFVVAIGPALIGLGTMLEVLGAVASSLAVLVSPIGLVIAAVAALGVAFATNWGGIRDAVMPVVTAIGDWLGHLANVLTGQFQPALAAVSGFLASVWRGDLEGAREALAEFWDALGTVDWGAIGQVLRDGLTAALQGLTDLGQAALGLATNLLSALGDAIGSIDWSGVATAIVGALGSAISTVVGIGETILSWIGDQLGQVDWSGVGTAVLDGISTAVSTLAQTAGELGGYILAWVRTNVESVDWAQVGQTILDGIGSALSQLREFETIDTLVSAIERLADVVGRLAPLAGGVAAVAGAFLLFGPVSGIITAVTTTVSTLSAIVVGLASAIGLVGGPVSMLIALFNPLTAILAGVAAAVGLVAAAFIGNWFGIRDAVMGAVGAIIGILGDLWNNLTSNAGPLLEQLRALWAALGPAIDIAKTALTAIAAVVGGVLVAALGLVMGALGGLVGALSGALPGAIKVATGVVQALTGAIQVVTAVVGGMVDLVVALFRGDWPAAWEAAKGIVTGFAEGVGNIISGLVTAVAGAFEALVGAVVGAISGFVQTIIGYFQGLYHALVGGSIIPDMVNGIISWISQLPGRVLGIIGGMVADVLGRMAGFAADMLAKGQEIISNVASGMTAMLGRVLSAAAEIISGVKGAFSGAISWLWQAGRDVIQGLINGIKGMLGAAVGAVGDVVSAVKNRVTGLLGISSPSTVMREIGQDTIAGLVKGLGDMTPEAAKAAADAGRAVLDTLRAALELARDMTRFRGGYSIPALDSLIDMSRRALEAVAGIARAFDKELLDHAKAAADAMKSAFGALSDAVNLTRQIAERDVVVPGEELAARIKFWAEHMIQSFGDSAAYLGDGLLEGSDRFAGAMTQAFEAMGAAVEFARAVASDRVILPGERLVSDIKFLAEHAVRSLGDSGIYLGDGLMAAAEAFSDAMTRAFEAMGAAVAFARQVAENELVLPSKELASDIKFFSEHVVQSLGDSGRYLGEGLMAASTTFAEAMTKAFEGMSAAVEFARLAMGQRIEIPSQALVRGLANLAERVVRAMGQAAQRLGSELLSAAEEAADGIVAAFDAIGAALGFALDAAKALREGPVMEVPQALIDLLAALAEAVTQAFVDATSRFESEVLETAEGAAGAVGAVLDVFQAAIDYVRATAELEEQGGVPSAAGALTGALAALIVGIVEAFTAAAHRLQTEALAAASSFAESIRPLVEIVSPVIQASREISEMSEITNEQMGVFTGNVQKISTVIERASQIAENARSSATRFAQTARETLRQVQDGVAALYQAAQIAATAPPVSTPSGTTATGVPQMARGGVVDRPTLAIIGERASARPEIVAPEPVLRNVLRDELGRAAPAAEPAALNEAVATLRRISRELARVLDRALVITADAIMRPMDLDRALDRILDTMARASRPPRLAPALANVELPRSRGADSIGVNFYGPVTIEAHDRAAAERAAGDIGWGVRTALRKRGVSV